MRCTSLRVCQKSWVFAVQLRSEAGWRFPNLPTSLSETAGRSFSPSPSYSTSVLTHFNYGLSGFEPYFEITIQVQLFSVNLYSTARLLYMFRAFYTPIIRSTISTVSIASSTNHSIVSATLFQAHWKKVAETIL